MKKLLANVVLGMSVFASHMAWGHGEVAARHGGVVAKAADLSFELVPQADGALLYLSDHGKPLAIGGMSGKLTVLNGSDKSEVELKPAGDRFEAKGVKLGKGAKAVAAVTTAAKKTVTVRFIIK